MSRSSDLAAKCGSSPADDALHQQERRSGRHVPAEVGEQLDCCVVVEVVDDPPQDVEVAVVGRGLEERAADGAATVQQAGVAEVLLGRSDHARLLEQHAVGGRCRAEHQREQLSPPPTSTIVPKGVKS